MREKDVKHPFEKRKRKTERKRHET